MLYSPASEAEGTPNIIAPFALGTKNNHGGTFTAVIFIVTVAEK